MRNEHVKRLTRLGMLGALSIVLVLFIHFPIFPAAPFLVYDPADIPILIGTFLYGPWYGLLLTVVVSVIQGLTVSAEGGPIGVVMHILATGAFAVVAGMLYRRKKTIQRAAVSLAAGSLAMTAVMVVCNLILTPIFMNASLQKVLPMLLPVIIPFNLLKAGINSAATFIIYKPVSRLFGALDHRRADKSDTGRDI